MATSTEFWFFFRLQKLFLPVPPTIGIANDGCHVRLAEGFFVSRQNNFQNFVLVTLTTRKDSYWSTKENWRKTLVTLTTSTEFWLFFFHLQKLFLPAPPTTDASDNDGHVRLAEGFFVSRQNNFQNSALVAMVTRKDSYWSTEENWWKTLGTPKGVLWSSR